MTTQARDIPLGGHFDPFTEGIRYLKADYDRVIARYRANNHAREPMVRWKVSEHRRPLESALPLLEPWAMPPWKDLVVECENGWIAFFGQSGSPPEWVDHLARQFRTLGLYTSYSPMVRRGREVVRHGDCAFWLVDGARDDLQPLCGLRSVQVSYQTSWEFHADGEVQAYEEIDRYSARRITDRFDVAMLNRYCLAIGIDRAHASFYRERAFLVELDIRRWGKPRSMSAEEWRRQHRA